MSVNPLLTNYNAIGSSLFAPASGGAGPGGGVTQLLAGTNVSLSPAGGTGVVTINASGGGGSNAPDQSFSTIAVATLIDGSGANLFISSINGAAPGVAGVSQIIAGSNVSIDPVGGTGAVTINASGGGSNAPDQSFSTIAVATSIDGSGANLFISSINGAAPGGGGTVGPDPSFSTINLATNGSINGPEANLLISSINGAIPQGISGYISTIQAGQGLSVLISGSGAQTAIIGMDDIAPVYPPEVAPGAGTFGTNVDPASAVTVLTPALALPFTLSFLQIGYYYISIPLTLQVAQTAPGTPVATKVTPGTFITHAIRVGAGGTQNVVRLTSVPVIGNATDDVAANAISFMVEGYFYCPVNSVTTFNLEAWATVPAGGSGETGGWCYSVPSSGASSPVAYIRQLV